MAWRTSSLIDLKSLNTKLAIMVAALCAVIMASAAYFSYQSQYNIHFEQFNKKNLLLSSVIVYISRDAFLSNDFTRLDQYLKENSHQQEALLYSIVLSPQNEHLSSYFRPEYQSAANSSNHVIETIKKINEPSREVKYSLPIIVDGKAIANLFIGFSTNHIEQRSMQVLQRTLVQDVMLIVLLCVGMFLVFRHKVIFPISELIHRAQRIEKGDLEHDANVGSSADGSP